MPTTWTDNPVTTATPVKALHVNQLRTAVNSLRQAAGLHQIDWTDHPVGSGQTRIKAVHFNELAGAIQDLWLRRSLGRLPSWSAGSPPSPNRPIRASDMNNLRSWVNTYESSSTALDPQGVVSFSFDPNAPSAIITQNWVNDAAAIGEFLPYQDTLLIRTKFERTSRRTPCRSTTATSRRPCRCGRATASTSRPSSQTSSTCGS